MRYTPTKLLPITLLLIPFLSLSGCGMSKTDNPKPPFHAVVDGSYTGAKGALVNGVKLYSTVQGAIEGAPEAGTSPYLIFVKKGSYQEKITITKPFIQLIGESEDQTILTYGATADTLKPDGSPFGTSGSASLTIAAGHFAAANLTIENSFDYPANQVKPDNDPTKVKNTQAVALKTDKGSSQAVFRNCKILGYQDTLFANSGTQYFTNCTIQGMVDFIFGAGQAVFQDCDIISVDRGSRSENGNGFITAASTQLTDPYGFLFLNCRLKKQDRNMGDGTVALGRPWHPSGDPNAVGSVIFKNCDMDAHISRTGWVSMSGFSPADARFYEVNSTGPGAIRSDSIRVLTDTDANAYTVTAVLGGWNPEVNAAK